MWIGLFLICMGIMILLNNMDIIRGDVWNYIWPLALVFVGVSLILKRSRKDRWVRWIDKRGSHPGDQPDSPRT